MKAKPRPVLIDDDSLKKIERIRDRLPAASQLSRKFLVNWAIRRTLESTNVEQAFLPKAG